MPPAFRFAAPLVVAVACCWAAAARQDFRQPDVFWHDDYAKALAESRKTGLPLFVVFTCPH